MNSYLTHDCRSPRQQLLHTIRFSYTITKGNAIKKALRSFQDHYQHVRIKESWSQ